MEVSGLRRSDCDAVVNIFRDHHFTKTQPEASALAIQRGMDNECIDFAKVKDDHDYRPYYDAYKQGFLKESEIDTALIRLFTARMKLGMFDPPEMVPYTKIDEKELDSPEHRALARTIANESMVLLKNDGTLPLKTGQTQNRRGRSAGRSNEISAWQLQRKSDPYRLRSRRAESGVPGSANQLCCRDAVPANRWRTGARVCVDHRGRPARAHREVLFGSRIRGEGAGIGDAHGRARVDLKAEDIPQEAAGHLPSVGRVGRFLTRNETGDYSIGVRGSGQLRDGPG